jgi:hypothetical protein
MARRTAAVIYNILNQTLELRFPKGRPTSATFSVYRAFVDIDNSAPAEFSGTATLETINTTTTSAAGPAQPDPQQLVLASYAGLQTGRPYLLQSNSVQEWVELIEIAGSYVRVRFPLQYDYASGATLASTWLTAAVDNTWITDASKLSDMTDTFPDFRVKWDVVYSGQTYTVYSFFDVVRALVRHNVEIGDVNARAPGLVDSLPVEYRVEDGRPLIDAAWSSVRAHLQAMNIQVDAIREDEVLDELVILRTLRVLAEGGWRPATFQDQQSYLEMTRSNYDRFIEQHFAASLKHRVDYQLGSLSRANTLPSINRPWFSK